MVGTPERVDGVHDAGLMRDHLLCAQREPHRVLGRKRKRLVEGVRMERLGAAEHRGKRLERGPDDVDLGLLRRQRHAGRLCVEAHEPRTRISRAVAFPQLARPDPPGGSVLRNFLEEVQVGVEEKRQARREVVDVEPAVDARLDVREAVGKRERELLGRVRSRFADVIPGDRHWMPKRHLSRAELDHVDHEPHRGLRREDPFLLCDVLLEDVRLDRPAQLRARDTLLLSDTEVEREQHRGG